MAFLHQSKRFERAILEQVGFKYPGLLICELGNQEIREKYKKYPAKLYYGNKGAIHMSIDINGKDGAYEHDMCTPIHDTYYSRFDLVTNYGTIEHIDNQYEAWRNVHNLCRIGGIMTHVLPLEGYYKGHCRYYYNEEMMKALAAAFQYEILHMGEQIRTRKLRSVAVAFRKTTSFWPGPTQFDSLGIIDLGPAWKEKR